MFFLNENLTDGHDSYITISEAALLVAETLTSYSQYIQEGINEDFQINVLNESSGETKSGFIAKAFSRLREMFSNIGKTIKKVADAIINFIKRLFGKGKEDTSKTAKDGSKQMVKGANSAISNIVNTLTNFIETVSHAYSTFVRTEAATTNSLKIIEELEVSKNKFESDFKEKFDNAEKLIKEGKERKTFEPISERGLSNITDGITLLEKRSEFFQNTFEKQIKHFSDELEKGVGNAGKASEDAYAFYSRMFKGHTTISNAYKAVLTKLSSVSGLVGKALSN